MPKQTLTLNGFAGGLNIDADESDLASSGQGEDEVQESKNFFLDKRGKIVAEYPEIGDSGTTGTGVDEDSGNDDAATKILVYTQKIYQQTGIFKVGEDINYKLNTDFFSYKPFYGELNEGWSDADSEAFGVDIDSFEQTADDYHLFLGTNASRISQRVAQPAAYFKNASTVFIPGYQIGWGVDADNDGQFGGDSFSQSFNEIDGTAPGSNDVVKIYDKDGDEIDFSSKAKTTGSPVTIDCNASGTEMDMISIHKAASSATDSSISVGFVVGHTDMDASGDTAIGTYGHYSDFIPTEYIENRTICIEAYIADITQGFQGLYIYLDADDNDAPGSDDSTIGYTASANNEWVQTYFISVQDIIDEGGAGKWNTYYLDPDAPHFVGSNFNITRVSQIGIVAGFTEGVTYSNTDTYGAIRIREFSFLQDRDVGLWNKRNFRLSQTIVNSKGIESTAKIYPGIFTGKKAPQNFALYKPSTSGLAGKIYYEETDREGSAPKTGMFLLAEYDYTNGVKPAGADNFTPWVSASGKPSYVEFSFDDPPLTSTYQIESGYPSDTSTVNALWECSTTVGRQAYIGNCTKETSQKVINCAYEAVKLDLTASGNDGKLIRKFGSWEHAWARFTVADGDANCGMTQKEYIKFKSTDGTEKTYVVVDDNDDGGEAATGTILASDTNIGGGDLGSAAGDAHLIGGIAVAINTTGSVSSQNDFLVQLIAAINGGTGHNAGTPNSKIDISAAPTEANGAQSIGLTQVVGGPEANAVVTSTITNLTVTNFTEAESVFATGDQVHISGSTASDGLYTISSFAENNYDANNTASESNPLVLTTNIAGSVDQDMTSGLLKMLTFASSSDASLILKSAIGRAAGFSDTTYIDLEFGGDTLKVLENIGDRLFAFSQNQLTVINVAQDIEFVESTLPGQGIKLPRQVCKFNEMLAFVNGSGAYMFNGEGITNISDLKLRSATWDDDNCAIVFDAKRTILVIWSAASKQYYYSPIYQQFVGESAVGSQLPTTNAVIADKQYSYYNVSGVPKILGADSVSAHNTDRDVQLETGKISCGNIAQRKNFYKLYITTTRGGNLTVQVMTDESPTSYTTVTTALSNDEDAAENEISLRSSGSLPASCKGKWIKILIKDTSTNASAACVISDISIVFKGRAIK